MNTNAHDDAIAQRYVICDECQNTFDVSHIDKSMLKHVKLCNECRNKQAEENIHTIKK